MKIYSLIGALVIGVGLCSPSYGFEWLDRLLGIDLDNSQGRASYWQPAPYYAPYSVGYSPYVTSYQPNTGVGCGSCGSQATYGAYYQAAPVTSYQPAAACEPCGNQATTFRPVVTYRVQSQLVPFGVSQPVFVPTTSYAWPTTEF